MVGGDAVYFVRMRILKLRHVYHSNMDKMSGEQMDRMAFEEGLCGGGGSVFYW